MRVRLDQLDPDRQPLGDLDVVARRVLRRQERRRGARGGAEPLDPPPEDAMRVGVDVEVDRVADDDGVELALLEVGVDPDPLHGPDRHQRLPRRDLVPRVDGPVLDVAGDRRSDLGIAQLQPAVVEVALRLPHLRRGLADLGRLVDEAVEGLLQLLVALEVEDLLQGLVRVQVDDLERQAEAGERGADFRHRRLDRREPLLQLGRDVQGIVDFRIDPEGTDRPPRPSPWPR